VSEQDIACTGPDDYATLGQVQREKGVGRNRLRQWVLEGSLKAYVSRRDRRERLVRCGDVDDLLKPTPFLPAEEAGEGGQGKAAA
jgi:hypothetical protein